MRGRPTAKPVKGYPVALLDPAQVAAGTAMVAESINDPAIGDLDKRGHDDIVVASDEVYGAPEPSELSFAGLTASVAGSSGRLYAIDGATGKIMPGWPVAMPGLIQEELPLIGPGQDAAIAKIGGADDDRRLLDRRRAGGAQRQRRNGAHDAAGRHRRRSARPPTRPIEPAR